MSKVVRHWRRVLVLLGFPCLVLAVLWGANRSANDAPQIELRQDGEATLRMSAKAATTRAEQRAGFRPSLAGHLPTPGMRLRFIDTTGLATEKPYVDHYYSDGSVSVTVHESPDPRDPGGRPTVIGDIPGATVWWSPFLETQHFYIVRTETRFMIIQVDGNGLPDQDSMLRMIASMVHR